MSKTLQPGYLEPESRAALAQLRRGAQREANDTFNAWSQANTAVAGAVGIGTAKLARKAERAARKVRDEAAARLAAVDALTEDFEAWWDLRARSRAESAD